eukprot:TRINITY_DN4504_c0_g1_i1.p4 TRINITY_DN4504_c0_g1~~TRINITY_DN4504_c0_g1_i1.p4  ORF type:complete len:171 (+),score=39.57 TRINITY_DN4504_c0_g1_i1:782-1294(+)
MIQLVRDEATGAVHALLCPEEPPQEPPGASAEWRAEHLADDDRILVPQLQRHSSDSVHIRTLAEQAQLAHTASAGQQYCADDEPPGKNQHLVEHNAAILVAMVGQNNLQVMSDNSMCCCCLLLDVVLHAQRYPSTASDAVTNVYRPAERTLHRLINDKWCTPTSSREGSR